SHPPPQPALFPYTTLFRSFELQPKRIAKTCLAEEVHGGIIRFAGDKIANSWILLLPVFDEVDYALIMVLLVFPRHRVEVTHNGRSEEHTSELQSRLKLVWR